MDHTILVDIPVRLRLRPSRDLHPLDKTNMILLVLCCNVYEA